MKIKTEKGITLVALIITVVLLLILSIVAITGLKETGILGYAENATSKFEEGQKDEQGILNGYVNSLNNGNVENEPTAKTISFTIDGVEYQAEEGMTWAEWLESPYSTGADLYINVYGSIKTREDMCIASEMDQGTPQNTNNFLINGEEYFSSPWLIG